MNCYYCKEELLWCSDYDISDEDENYSIVTNFICRNCDSVADFLMAKVIENE